MFEPLEPNDEIEESYEQIRRFALYRHNDPSGVTGTGVVAVGTEWPHGEVHLFWHSTTSYKHYKCVEEVMRVHGHSGLTELVWLDCPQMLEETYYE